ncbi:MAG: glycosyltransferase family 4 protein [Bacillota bacterium]
MRISIDTRGAKLYAGTGIGTYTRELMKNIMHMDKENQYLFFWPGEGYEQFSDMNNIEVQLVGTKNKTFWTYDYIPQQLKMKKTDLHHIPQNGIGLPKDKWSKYVVTIHDLIPFLLPDTVGESYKERFTEEMPSIVKNADAIITVSEYSKNDIIRFFGLDPDKIIVTHLATDDIYKPMNHKRAQRFLESRYHISGDFILYLGGFSSRKNVTGLIHSYKRCINKFSKHYDLVLVGAPKDAHDEIVHLIQTLKLSRYVKFTGFVPNEHLPFFYNAASLFVYPSLYEGFGLPPLEAMSCGCPTITSNVSSIPEVVGDAALLIDPTNIEQLADAMAQILEDKVLAMNLIMKGLRKAASYSWEATAAKTLDVYKRLLHS